MLAQMVDQAMRGRRHIAVGREQHAEAALPKANAGSLTSRTQKDRLRHA